MVCYYIKLSCDVGLADLITGPIVEISLAGDDIIVLSDPSDAEELASVYYSSSVYTD
jgi:hypothetical protein